MKKIFILALTAISLTACNEGKKQQDALTQQRDSLSQIIAQKDSEIDDMLGTLNDIEEGFREINQAQGRVNLNPAGSERSSKEDIMENISFIQRTLALNRERISRLQQQLKTSSLNGAKLKETIAELNRQMQEKQEQIAQLQAQLEESPASIPT